MKIFLRSVLLFCAAPAFSAAQPVDWNSLKANLADPNRKEADSVPGVPAAQQPGDLSQFRRNLLLSSDNWQRDENAIKKSLVRVTAEGAYEVDMNAESERRFGNPSLAALPNGAVILNYGDILADRRRYEKLLGRAGIFERRDSDEIMRFYQQGSEIPSFTAFGELATEDFLDTLPAAAPLTNDERERLRGALKTRKLVALALLPSGPGQKSRALKVYDGAANALYELSVPAADPSAPPTFLELHSALQDPHRLAL